jgi:hypothetical protein
MLNQIVARNGSQIKCAVKQNGLLFIGGSFQNIATAPASVRASVPIPPPNYSNFAIFDLSTGNITQLSAVFNGPVNSMAAISNNRIVIGGAFTNITAGYGMTVQPGNHSGLTVLNTDTMTFSQLNNWSLSTTASRSGGLVYPAQTNISKVKYDSVSDLIFVCGSFLFDTTWGNLKSGMLAWKASDLTIVPNVGGYTFYNPSNGGAGAWPVSDVTFGNFSIPSGSGRGLWVATPYYPNIQFPNAYNITDPNNAFAMGWLWIQYTSSPLQAVGYSSSSQSLVLVAPGSFLYGGAPYAPSTSVTRPIIRVPAGGSSPGSLGYYPVYSYPLTALFPFNDVNKCTIYDMQIDDSDNVSIYGTFSQFNGKDCYGFCKFNLADAAHSILNPLINLRYQSGYRYGPSHVFTPYQVNGSCYCSVEDDGKLHLFGSFPFYQGYDRTYNYKSSHLILNADGSPNPDKFAF